MMHMDLEVRSLVFDLTSLLWLKTFIVLELLCRIFCLLTFSSYLKLVVSLNIHRTCYLYNFHSRKLVQNRKCLSVSPSVCQSQENLSLSEWLICHYAYQLIFYIPISHHTNQPPCSPSPFSHYANQQLCLSAIMPISHHSQLLENQKCFAFQDIKLLM